MQSVISYRKKRKQNKTFLPFCASQIKYEYKYLYNSPITFMHIL